MRILAGLACALFLAACTVEPVDFSGRMCPCKGEWICDVASNQCVLATPFVAGWAFDDDPADGLAEDTGGGSLHARCEGQACPRADEGVSGGAAVFDGVDDRMIVPFGEALQTRSGFTVSMWLRPDDLSRATPAAKLREAEATDAVSWAVELDAAGRIAFGTASSARGVQRVWSEIDAARAGQWVHVAGTWSGDTAELHVDGSVAGSTPALAEFFQGDILFGGNAEGPGLLPYAGAVDEVRLYGRVLAGDEIAELARAE